MQCDIGVVGLGVMGSNLALNMERNGFRIAGYDLDATKPQGWVSGPAAGRNVEIASSPDALMAMLQKPRRVLMMVPAGHVVHLSVLIPDPAEAILATSPGVFDDKAATQRRRALSHNDEGTVKALTLAL